MTDERRSEACIIELGYGEYLLVIAVGRAYLKSEAILDPRLWLFSLN